MCELIKIAPIYHIDENDAKSILYYYVNQLLIKSDKESLLYNNFYNRQQAAGLIFGHGIKKIELITRMLDVYGDDFFEYKNEATLKSNFRPNIIELKKHHPNIFGDSASSTNIEQEMILALQDEIGKMLRNTNNSKNWLPIKDIRHSSNSKEWIYKCYLDLEEEDQVVSLVEDTKVTLRKGKEKWIITILEYDAINNEVIFQSPSHLKILSGAIESNCAFLLKALKDKIQYKTFCEDKFYSMFLRKIDVLPETFNNELLTQGLDKSQIEAMRFSLNHSISYIWGPPGTGKSHTLSTLLANLFNANEKTLVCSIANVAVDGLTLKFMDRMMEFNNKNIINPIRKGQVLRCGFVKDKNILEKDNLFPDTREIKELRETIDNLEKSKKKIKRKDKIYTDIINQIHNKRKELDEAIKKITYSANILFVTSSKAVIDNSISEMEFDNLVIDEGSMMAIPHLYALLYNVKKRVIIAGDFQQLGPISVACTDMSEKWLKKDLFSLLGKKNLISKHPNVRMLTNQRRCAPDIIDLVNRRFYDGLLTTDLTEKHLVASEPIFGNNHVEFLNISHLEEYQFGFTAGGSRFNDASREAVKTLLIEIYHKFKDIKSVGIISPYTAQISRIKKDILEIKKQITFPFEIKEGTIHTFQGSECDIIIFDMVESLKCIQKQESNIGALYRNETGERLINVALSRAISKLIIVGCTKVLVEGKKEAQVRSSVKTIIKDAYNKSFMKN